MASIRRKNTRWRVMPYAYGDYILTCGEFPYQSFGLDNKKELLVDKSSFLLAGVAGYSLKRRFFRLAAYKRA